MNIWPWILFAVSCGAFFAVVALQIVAVAKETPETSEVIRIKYLTNVDKIEKIKVGDWIDLRAAEDVSLSEGEFKFIPLGVAMELPEGYEALVAPRSSTFRKHGILLANSIGIIDELYKGDDDEWHFPAYAVRDAEIPKNERICQFRIIKHQPEVIIHEVETLGNQSRGGLGSTGRM